MSNSTKQSLAELIEELGKARKNFGFPVIVAFDRKTANHVLKQEFIERYSGGLFIDPMNSEVDLEAGVSYHQLSDFCLDEPRLSFENADLSDSKAALLMRTVRGKQIQLSQPVGSTRRRVTRLAEATPINGPALVFDIELKAVTTGISEAGRVHFNFAAGSNYAFHGGVTPFEIDKLGQHFKQYFEEFNETPDQKPRIEYTLGKITQLPDSPLKPHKFAIRTHGAPETKLKNTDNFGDGAVVLFVELEGFDSSNAVPPDEDKKLPYLLPDGFSANVLLNSNFIVANLIVPQLKSSASSVRLLDWESMHASNWQDIEYIATGKFKIPEITYGGEHDYFKFYAEAFEYVAPAKENTKEKLRIKCDKGRLVIDWHGITDRYAHCAWGEYGDPTITPGRLITIWSFQHIFKVSVKDHKVLITRDGENQTFNWYVTGKLDEVLDEKNYFIREFIEDRLKQNFQEFLFDVNKSFGEIGSEIDIFILSALLFRNSQISLDAAHWPNDVAAIGELAPDRNKFTIVRSDNKPIDNGETSVLAGGKILFKTEPATEDVTWTVRHLPDYEGDNRPGDINKTTGAYTAPADHQFKGTHVKVIVTATKGTEVSHALVSVLRTSVNVYPSVMTVNIGAYGDIIAGEMDGQAISWNVEGLGDLGDQPIPDPLAQAPKRYFAPKTEEIPEWEPGMPEVDVVMRHSQVVVSSGNSQKTVDILLPVEVEGTYWLVAKAAGTGVKFEFWAKNKLGKEIQIPQDETSWHVRVGNGTIKEGLYTPDPNKSEEYAVIVAIHDTQFIPQYASMILPLPFIDVKQFLALHAPDEAKAIAGQ